MILDEKILSPPPYVASQAGPPPFPGSSGVKVTFRDLPAHILLQIVYSTFPQSDSQNEGKIERQRRTLLWLTNSLRLVNRACYIACMHVLRSTYLPAYQSLIRPPYTSDPFPTPQSNSSSYSIPSYSLTPSPTPLQTLQRETPVLDRFIALKVRQDVLSDDSELHLERKDLYKDIFDLLQPRARLEDLVRHYGCRNGVISISARPPSALSSRNGSAVTLPSTPIPSSPGPSAPSPTSATPRKPISSRATAFLSSLTSSKSSSSPQPPSEVQQTPAKHEPQITPIPFSCLSISFGPRNATLIINAGTQHRRSLVHVVRTRDDRLEDIAKRLVHELYLLSA